MELKKDSLYPLVEKTRAILPHASCLEFIDDNEDTIRYKLKNFGLSNQQDQNKYTIILNLIRDTE